MSIKIYVEIECGVKGKILLEYFMKYNNLADFPVS